MDELSGEELADGSRVTAEQLWRLVELGVITLTSRGRYRRSDIRRSRSSTRWPTPGSRVLTHGSDPRHALVNVATRYAARR